MSPNEILGATLEQIEGLPAKDVSAAVTAAIQLKKEIEEKTERLEALKEYLRKHGRRKRADGNVVQLRGLWTGEGAKVSFSAPKAISAFWFPQGDTMAWRYKDNKVVLLGDIRGLAGEYFPTLFYTQFKPSKNFGPSVQSLIDQALLPKKNGEKLLDLCLEEITPKVELGKNS